VTHDSTNLVPAEDDWHPGPECVDFYVVYRRHWFSCEAWTQNAKG
jgi:hypothetical protein